MRYIAAYLLATLGGNKRPSAADVEGILKSVGIQVEDKEKLDFLIHELQGKNLEDLVNAGLEKLATIPGGGAPAGAAAPAAAAAAPAAAAAAAPAAAAPAAKKEEKKPEPPAEESDDDMGFGLFD